MVQLMPFPSPNPIISFSGTGLPAVLEKRPLNGSVLVVAVVVAVVVVVVVVVVVAVVVAAAAAAAAVVVTSH